MPEIAEVARTVHFIRKHLVGHTIATITAADDTNVYGKNLTGATTGADFQKHLKGNKIIDAGQQGKYFWMIMEKAPHPVMHFGMSGWLKYRSEHTYYYRKKEEDKIGEEWPPKFWKFHLETKPEKGEEKVEAAFVDMRRFARIRLVDCPGKEIREYSPLKENGPDPVQDNDVFTLEFFKEMCGRKKVPIKAMLLDQANLSGIGNWVGDEIMYHAKMHPEQYANTLADNEVEKLYKSIEYVCGTAVDLLADSEKFPEDWLFKHRWGKGKKDAPKTMPNGEKIVFLTVGGRTSAVVPSVQKKTGAVAKEMSEAESDEDAAKKSKGKKRKAEKIDEEEAEQKPAKKSAAKKTKKEPEMNGTAVEEAEQKPARKAAAKKTKKESEVNGEKAEVIHGIEVPKQSKARAKKVAVKEEPSAEVNGVEDKNSATKASSKKSKAAAQPVKESKPVVEGGRRRSTRNSRG